MPTPTIPIIISIANTNLSAGEYVKVTNLTSGGTLTGKVNSSGEVALNPADTDLEWSNGDTVEIESNGRIVFNASRTITKGGVKYANTTSTADDSPAVSL